MRNTLEEKLNWETPEEQPEEQDDTARLSTELVIVDASTNPHIERIPEKEIEVDKRFRKERK